MIPLAIIPWILQRAAGHRIYQSSILDLPLSVFFLTALLGVWTAYNRGLAWDKFWVILAGFFLFQALAKQPKNNLWALAVLPGVLGMLVTLYFLGTYDWVTQPSDLAVLTRIGLRWMAIRPAIEGPYLHPNIAGGVIALFFPFTIAATRYFLRSGMLAPLVSILGVGAINLLGLVLTSSRAAWISLALGLGIWFIWVTIRQWPVLTQRSKGIIFFTASLLVLLIIFGLVLVSTQGIGAVLGNLPGPNNTESRLVLYRNSLDLIRDFLLTGGGLGSFPGLYSQYILSIPQPFFDYSHNLFLDVWIEQGLLGFLAFLTLIVCSMWDLIKAILREQDLTTLPALLKLATLAGFSVFILHGLVDDAPYGMQGMPILLYLPAMAVFLARFPVEARVDREVWNIQFHRSLRPRGRNIFHPGLWATLSLAVLLLFSLIFWKPIASLWYSNWGSVAMARLQLAGWPTGKWEEGQQIDQYQPVERTLQRSLDLNSSNPTALYRLGLIAMQRQEYASAVSYLDLALISDPRQRGVIKSLGYSYVWLSQYGSALEYLKAIPEAAHELRTYTSWWPAHGRADLGEHAREMLSWLQDAG